MRKSLKTLLALSVVTAGSSVATTASARSEPFLGEIREVGFNYCPRGWASADGQLLPIAQNQALFSLFGTMYGGDGRTTFGLPDLRGRASIHVGRGPGLADYRQGAKGGVETVTLNISNMPSHQHGPHTHRAGVRTVADAPDTHNPAGNSLAQFQPGQKIYSTETPKPNNMQPRFMNPDTLFVEPATGSPAGGSLPHENRMPYQVTLKCVAFVGIYPSRP